MRRMIEKVGNHASYHRVIDSRLTVELSTEREVNVCSEADKVGLIDPVYWGITWGERSKLWTPSMRVIAIDRKIEGCREIRRSCRKHKR